MEIIYHPQPLNGESWELINDYLCSEDLPNVEIGLLLLEQNPRATIYAEVGLILTQYFGSEQQKMRAQILLNTYLDKKRLTSARQFMQIFENDAPNTLNWVMFAPQLQFFEQEGNLYAHYILHKTRYLNAIATLAHNLLLYNQAHDQCWLYTNRVLAQNEHNLRARMCWVELLIRHYFPKGQKQAEKANFKQVLSLLYQKFPNLQPIISYYLGVFYTEFEPSKADALHWLEICEKSGIMGAYYLQVFELIKRWKATV